MGARGSRKTPSASARSFSGPGQRPEFRQEENASSVTFLGLAIRLAPRLSGPSRARPRSKNPRRRSSYRTRHALRVERGSHRAPGIGAEPRKAPPRGPRRSARPAFVSASRLSAATGARQRTRGLSPRAGSGPRRQARRSSSGTRRGLAEETRTSFFAGLADPVDEGAPGILCGARGLGLVEHRRSGERVGPGSPFGPFRDRLQQWMQCPRFTIQARASRIG